MKDHPAPPKGGSTSADGAASGCVGDPGDATSMPGSSLIGQSTPQVQGSTTRLGSAGGASGSGTSVSNNGVAPHPARRQDASSAAVNEGPYISSAGLSPSGAPSPGRRDPQRGRHFVVGSPLNGSVPSPSASSGRGSSPVLVVTSGRMRQPGELWASIVARSSGPLNLIVDKGGSSPLTKKDD